MGGAMSAFVPPLKVIVPGPLPIKKQGKAACISKHILLKIKSLNYTLT